MRETCEACRLFLKIDGVCTNIDCDMNPDRRHDDWNKLEIEFTPENEDETAH